MCVCSLRLSPIETNLLFFCCSLLCAVFYTTVAFCFSFFSLLRARAKEQLFFFGGGSSSSFDLASMYVRSERERERERTRGRIVRLCMSLISPALVCVCVHYCTFSFFCDIYSERREKRKYSNKNEKRQVHRFCWIISLRKRWTESVTLSMPCYFLVGITFALAGSGRVGERWPRMAFIGTGTLRR